jgi:hypothetical protein
MKNIEETICDTQLPVNSKAILNRIHELLEEHQTNSLASCAQDIRVQKLMWLLNSQAYGQLATFDMAVEWQRLKVQNQPMS